MKYHPLHTTAGAWRSIPSGIHVPDPPRRGLDPRVVSLSTVTEHCMHLHIDGSII